MFQKHSMLSLKKKSKSLGHLTAINQYSPYSPEQQPKVKKNGGADFSFTSGGGGNGWAGGGNGRSRFDSVQPTNAAKYMKRFLSPVSYDRDPVRDSSWRQQDVGSRTNHRQDKQQQTKKTTPKKLKGVMKNKNGGGSVNTGGETAAAASGPMAMGKALISRNFSPQKSNGNRSHSTGSPAGGMGGAVDDLFQGKSPTSLHGKHRVFIIDTQVKYTVGVQMQERNLFLFNDLLLIAKERSSSHFKLKDQVPLSDVWLSDCISEVSEVTLDPTCSFVIGWPITNAVLTFRTRDEKDQWWSRLQHLVATEREHTATGASICITYFDTTTNFEHVKNVYVSRSDSAKDCIKKALNSLPILENGDLGSTVNTNSDNTKNSVTSSNSSDGSKSCDNNTHASNNISAANTPSKVISAYKKGEDEGGGGPEGSGEDQNGGQAAKSADYQLWVKTKFDESPYPLIGHEIPLVIKLNFMRQAFNSKKGNSYDEYRRCTFILRRIGQMNNFNQDGSQKKKLKKVKSSIKLQNVFRRVSQATGKSSDSVDAAQSSSPLTVDKKAGKLFGKKLEDLCGPTQDPNKMPQPIKDMLHELEEKGPSTLGIFRRGPNVRAMREVREQLDEFDPSAAPVDGESGVDIGNSCKQVDWSKISVFVTAALLKDFLRSLPDCLLQSDNYNSWMQANTAEDIKALNSCIKSLPTVNQYLLHHLLYVLHKTSQNSQENMMTSSNLSICVGPSILWTQDPQYSLDPAYTKEVSSLLETLIDNYSSLYDGTPSLFNTSKPNHRGGYDHSSLDSLLDPAGPEEDLNRQNGLEGVSLTNLSQDSGLTTSDSQLYNAWEDEEYSSEDFTIERISSNQGWGRHEINFLYQNNYLAPHNNHKTTSRQPDEGHSGASSSPPQQQQSGGRKQNRRHQKNRDRMHRRIHRSADYSSGVELADDSTHVSQSFNNYSPMRSDSLYLPPLRRTASEESIQQLLHQKPTTSGHNNNNINIYLSRRTASEESIQQLLHQKPTSSGHNNNNNIDIIQISTGGKKSTPRPRSGGPRKARAPNPPKGGGNSVIRSNSVNQVRDWETRKDWYRSKSTTLLHSDEEEGVNSCSTLSDEDSTPHVSRSNSYGRAEEPGGGGGQGDLSYSGGHHHHHHHHNNYPHQPVHMRGYEEGNGGLHHIMYGGGGLGVDEDTTYDIYLHDDRTLNLETNLEAALSNNISRDKQIKDLEGLNCETPPGYEESIYRQRLLKLQGQSGYPSGQSTGSSNSKLQLPDRSILEEQEQLSAKAKAVFEASLRQYNTEVNSSSTVGSRILYNGGESLVDVLDGLDPPPLPPKTDRPPLPPKQRSRRSAEPDSSDDQTYVNSADIVRSPVHNHHSGRSSAVSAAGNRSRISINSPVLISTNTTPISSVIGGSSSSSSNNRQHSQQQNSLEDSQFVYGSYYSSGANIISQDSTRVSVPVMIQDGQKTPPLLPPKETSASPQPNASAKKLRQVTSTKIGSTAKVMRSVETQTDDNEFMIVYPEDGEEIMLEDVTGSGGNLYNPADGYNDDSEYSPEESNRSLSPDLIGGVPLPPAGVRHSSFDYGGSGNRSLSPPNTTMGGGYGVGYHHQLYSPHFSGATQHRDLYNSRPVSSASVVSGRDHHELREAARRKLEPSASEHLSSAISQRTPAAGRSNRISLDSTISVGSNHRLLVGSGDMMHSPAVSSAAGGSRATSVTETTVSSHSSSGSGGSTGTGGSSSVDPLIAGEINWSVSQLRSLFNQGLGKAAAAAQQHNQINHSHLSSEYNTASPTPYSQQHGHSTQHNILSSHNSPTSNSHSSHHNNLATNLANNNNHRSSPYPPHHTYAAYPAEISGGDSPNRRSSNTTADHKHNSGGNRLMFNGGNMSGGSGLPRYYPSIQQQRHYGGDKTSSAVSKTLFMGGGSNSESGNEAESDQESYV